MTKYFTKEGLYNEIHKYKGGLGLDQREYGFNMIDLCVSDGIMLEKLPFKTRALRGLASVGSTPEEDVILLNLDRNDREQNFDCGHEYTHLCIHRELKQKIFNCIDSIYAKQNVFIEWQANEGSAEMFVPYEVLLPYIKSNRHLLCSTWDIMGFKESAANLFNVTAKVIEYRLESLKYEIQQYLDGTPLDKIRILSLSQQNRLKINVQSINDKENDLFYKEHPDWDDSCFACQSHALNGRGFYD